MWIYWIIFIILFGGMLFISSDIGKNKLANIIIFLFILLGSLRSYCVGTDTFGYILVIFPDVFDTSYIDIIKDYNDSLFYIIIKLIHSIIPYNFAIFTFISLVFWIPTILVLKKYSNNLLLSIIVLLILRYTDFYLSAMRLALPLGMAGLAMHYTIKGKFLKFILSVLIASLFHQSSFVLIIIYLFRYINVLSIKTKWLNIFALLLPLLSGILYKIIFVRLLTGERFESYQNDNSVKLLAFLIVLFLFIFVNTFRPNKYSLDYRIFFSCCFISLIFASILLVNGAFYRMTLFFQLSFAFMVPISLYQLKHKFYLGSRVFIIGLFFIYLLGGPSPSVVPYSFFWNPQKNSTHLMEGARAQDYPELIYIYSNNELPVYP